MKRISKKSILLFLVLLMSISTVVLPVSAANGPVMTTSATSVQPGKSFTVTVGFSYEGGISGGEVEVTYYGKLFWFSLIKSSQICF